MPFPRRFSPARRTPAPARALKTFMFTLAAALACGLLLYAASPRATAAADAATPQTGLIDVTTSGASPVAGSDLGAAVTPDGRYVAFTSASAELTPNDTSNAGVGSNVFVRDRRAGRTVLVSVTASGKFTNPFTSSDSPVITPDGRYVAFVSDAPNLVATEDANGSGLDGPDVFVRDMVAETTSLVSVNKDGTASGHGPSGGLSMTADGRFVVFISAADDLVPGDTNGVQDVFLRDVQAGTTALVSADTSGAPAGILNRNCEFSNPPYRFFKAADQPSVSADGRYVAFRSAVAGLSTTPDTNCASSSGVGAGGYDVFVRDMQAGSNRLVTTNRTGATAGETGSTHALITPDGRHVFFNSNADDLVGNDANGRNEDLFVNVNLPAAGQVQFAQQSFSVSESAGQAVVTVTRTPGATGAATVSYTTLGGAAAAGADFAPTSGTLNFAAGEESKQFVVPVLNDAADEADETVFVRLTDEAGGSVGEPAFAAILIADDDPSPRLTVSDARVGEGDYPLGEMTFLVTLSEPSQRTITANFTTQNGTATGGTWPGGNFPPGVDYENFQGTYTFPPGATRGLLKVRVFPDTTLEPDETFSVVFSNPVNVEIANGVGVGTIVDDDGAVFTKVQLSTNAHTVSETAGRLEVQLTRTGDLSAPSVVGYWSLPFTLNTSPRTDYTEPAGVVKFAAGESTKTLTVFITDDALLENDEQFYLVLFEPEGCTIGAPGATLITIKSDDAADGPSPARQQGSTAFFVRQHYRDFLGRDPDAEGLAFWTNEIESCGADQQCREVKRINVSAAFFLSIEFQETGYLAYKSFKVAYGNLVGRPVPIPLYWFLHDAQFLGQNVVVNQGDWLGQLERNKRDYFDHFARSEVFNLAYPATLAPAEFVAALDANAGSVLTAGERAELAGALAAGTKTRAEVLRAVAENAELSRRELNRAFVLMEYFGYLRRNPDESPDFNFEGYNFWLGKLEEHNGDAIAAEMVKAFITSDEYLKRFGQ